MKNNHGITEIILLGYIIAGLALLFVPNPVSKAMGMGVQPNKTVERVELIKDKEGVPIAYKTTITDQQQRATLWQSLLALPRLWLLMMILGCFFTPLSAVMAWVNKGLKTGFKQVVSGIEEAKKLLPLESVNTLETNLSKKMDTTTKEEVKKVKVTI